MKFVVLLTMLLGISLSANAAGNDSAPLATYDGNKLTAEEFAKRESNLLSWAGISAGADQIQSRVEDLVFDALVATEAKRTDVADDPEVKLQIDRILRSAYLKKELPREEVEVSNEEIEKFYSENKERYRNPELSRISHLLFKTEQQAQSARRLLATSSWDAVAAQSSDPISARLKGSLGSIPQQGLMLPLFNAISAAGEGTISDPVKTVFGYHLVSLEKVPSISYRPLEDVRHEIYEQLIRQKKQVRLDSMKNALWKKYDVQINRNAIDSLVEQNSRAKLDVDLTLAGKRPQVVGKVPDLQVISDSIDFGAITSKPFTESLLLGNSSERTVTIDRVGSTCPCIKSSVGKIKLAPGEVTRLTFTYSPQVVDDRGRVERVVFIDSDDSIRPKAFIKLRFDVGGGSKS